jgi:GAF domain-containing protein/HAMP domain-containing protein
MNRFRQFFTPSIRRRITSAFLILTVFVLVMAIASYVQLRQVRPYSDAIIQNSSDQVELQKMAAATSALDADLERYLVIRGVEYQESVQTDLQEIADAFAVLKSNPTTDIQSELAALEETITRLQLGVQQVLEVQAAEASSGEITRRIVTVYDDIDQLKQQQEELAAKTLSGLQSTAQTQSQIANNVLTQFVILGIVVLVIAVATAITTDRRLRTISTLTNTATEIAAGDLSRVAPVESDDEIGTLAQSFNAMTSQLREFIGTLEQRVSERTRELTLAAEVGRALSQERELDRLLRDAVERIQSSFDLYYTQIYLVGSGGETLELRSGTGTVGVQLIQRRHRLPLNSGSINGLAAIEKRPVVVADTTTSALFRPNPLLPDTRSELAMPLMAGDRVVGVLDMQSQQAGALSEEIVPAFDALAGQLAIAIENAALFIQTQEAQSELENQARRLTREGWREFLDAIERSERIGYIYDRVDVKPNNDIFVQESRENVLVTPLQMAGEEIGSIYVEPDSGQHWGEEDSELVSVVANQVSRQVENLRLLAQAERYREEAEVAARRLTRQGWEDYLRELEASEIGFVYDQTQVYPTFEREGNDDSEDQGDDSIIYPLKIRDETIGELVLEGSAEPGEGDLELINEVTDRLSAHLESLRLTAQTQVALAQTDTLYGISASLNEAADESELLQAISQPAIEAGVFSSILVYLDLDEKNQPEWAKIVAAWPSEEKHAVPIGTRFYLPEMPFARLWVADPNEPLLVSDINSDIRVDENTKFAMAQGGSRAIAIIPLTRSGQQIGLIIFNWDHPHSFNPQESETYRALIGLGSPAVQNRRLFEQTQTRAQHERILRQVTERVRGSIDPDTVLRTAVRELGNVLGRNVLIRLGGQFDSDEG